MDQYKIGKIIKDIRIKNNLSQKEFANKYGVTYQAVSKWENGKNMPDIAILKEICNDYNLDLESLLDAKLSKQKHIFKYLLSIILFILVVLGGIYILFKDNNDFEFKTISSTCDDFKLHGSIAYNKNKSSIYIDGLSYCGVEDKNIYKEIKCSLYEDLGNVKNEISSYQYNKNTNLNDFLKNVNFKIDDYEQTCKTYDKDSLYLEIEATLKDNKTIFYKIPLSMNDTCSK